MENRFPRLVRPHNTHYLIHKVVKAEVDDRGLLRFKYDDGSGEGLIRGPFYPSFINGEVPLAVQELAKNNLESPDEVRYLVAYHCGAIPSGVPAYLLRSLDEIAERCRRIE